MQPIYHYMERIYTVSCYLIWSFAGFYIIIQKPSLSSRHLGTLAAYYTVTSVTRGRTGPASHHAFTRVSRRILTPYNVATPPLYID